MIYPKNFEEKIDFDQIRLLIKENCLSAMGQQKVNAIVFSPDLNEIVRLQEETEEFRQILLFEPAFPAQDYIDLTQELTRLQLEGTFIETESLNDLKAVLKTIQACLLFSVYMPKKINSLFYVPFPPVYLSTINSLNK